jgi:hypothetical protein
MASNRTVFHVVPNSGGEQWLVTEEEGNMQYESTDGEDPRRYPR